jgi:hypothetical protein
MVLGKFERVGQFGVVSWELGVISLEIGVISGLPIAIPISD